MKKYRKKPVVIEAVQWNGESLDEIREMTGCKKLFLTANKNHLLIPTLEGTMACNVGDWIIKGVKGEYYSCNDEIFQMTYEDSE